MLSGHSAALREARFTPDGRHVLTASEDSTARLWEVDNVSRIAELRGHTARVVSTAISPDGRWIATASDDRTSRLWDVETRQLLVELRGHTEGLSHVAFSPDGKSVITSGWDDTARVWDTRGTTVHRLDPRAQAAGLSPDGRYVATAGGEGERLRLWELPSGRELLALPGHQGAVLRFSADGKLLLSASGPTVQVLEVPNGRTVSTLEHPGSVTSAIFSPDGKLVLTIADNAVQLCRVQS